ncbi:hypothetical protein FACS1894109_15650 [Spirochaetia bacterium]|nr:hypothetical protein FACS1894109_15650 [Spirochaetia bacterium]
MTFGEAIDAAKNGFRITRNGWNGRGMFVYYQEGSTIMEADCRNKVIRDIAAKNPNGRVDIRAHLDMFTAQGDVQIGWLASQSDMLAEDWELTQ